MRCCGRPDGPCYCSVAAKWLQPAVGHSDIAAVAAVAVIANRQHGVVSVITVLVSRRLEPAVDQCDTAALPAVAVIAIRRHGVVSVITVPVSLRSLGAGRSLLLVANDHMPGGASEARVDGLLLRRGHPPCVVISVVFLLFFLINFFYLNF